MILGIVAGANRATAEMPQYLAAAHGSGGFSVWPVSPAGFGAKLASPSSGSPTGEGLWVGFSKTNKVIAVASRSGNGVVHAYPFNAATGTIGARMAQASSQPGGSYASPAAFHKDNNAIVFGGGASPAIFAYAWDDATGIGVKYADPSIGGASSANAANAAKFSKAGGAVAIAEGSSGGFLHVWQWSAVGGFGSLMAVQSAPLSARDVIFTSDSVIFSQNTSPFIHEYQWSDSTGLGAQRASPATLPAGNGYRLAMRKDEAALVVGNEGSGSMSPAVYSYTPGVGIGAAIAKAPGLPATVLAPAFSKDGDMAAFGYASSPYMSVNTFAAGAFGAKLANPATLPPAAVTYVNFSN